MGLAAVPAVILTIGGLVLPETPNSLIERGHHDKVRTLIAGKQRCISRTGFVSRLYVFLLLANSPFGGAFCLALSFFQNV